MKKTLLSLMMIGCVTATEPKTWKPSIEHDVLIIENGVVKTMKLRQELSKEEIKRIDSDKNGILSRREYRKFKRSLQKTPVDPRFLPHCQKNPQKNLDGKTNKR